MIYYKRPYIIDQIDPFLLPCAMKNAIAYYRVSTDKQGKSKLGLEAQEHSVCQFAEREGYTIINSFTEIESGKRDDRPQLTVALAQCKKQRATLIIAKLDRLSRRLSFIANLMDSKADFRAVDNPYASKPLIQMLAVFAEHERDLISQRTKEGLAAAKRKGVILGRNAIKELGPKNAAAAVQFAEQLRPTIETIQAEGFKTGRAIRDELNRRKVPTYRQGGTWHYCTVHAILKRLKEQATTELANP